MSDILNKVIDSSKFYSAMLDIDYKQVEFCYRTLKKYFKGKVACEVGPSIGIMTKMILEDFDEIDVVEGAKELLEQIPYHQKLKKYHSLLEDFDPSRKYDTIIMSHVLEHISDPVAVLKKLSTWLKKDGNLIVCVPNAKSFHRLAAVKMGLLESEYQLNERDMELGHYRIYDQETLITHAKTACLQIQHAGGIFLKFLSYSQMEQIFNNQMLEGFYAMGEDFPGNAAEIYIICNNI